MNLEEDLKQAFRRIDPPPNFADRVLDRLPKQRSRWHLSWYPAMAAALVVGCFAMSLFQQRQERIESAQRVQQELQFALELTNQKVIVVQARLERAVPAVRVPKEKNQL